MELPQMRGVNTTRREDGSIVITRKEKSGVANDDDNDEYLDSLGLDDDIKKQFKDLASKIAKLRKKE